MKKFRKTTFITILLVAVLVGLGFSRVGGDLDISWLALSIVMSGAFFMIGKKTRSTTVWRVCLIFVFFLVGWLRGSAVMAQLDTYDLLKDQQVTIEAVALEDSVYSEKGQMSFVVGNMFVEEPIRSDLVGELDVEGFGEPIIYRGDKVFLQGRLYKKRGGQQGGISFANIKLVGRNSSWIGDLRRDFAAGMQNTLPEPLASFGLGLLIGQRNTLSEALNQELIAVGLIHIVAVSGYNLTVIINMSQRLFAKRSRFQSLVMSLALIGLFLLLTGYSPSIVRAAVVSTLSLLAWYFGRKFKPVFIAGACCSTDGFCEPALYLV